MAVALAEYLRLVQDLRNISVIVLAVHAALEVVYVDPIMAEAHRAFDKGLTLEIVRVARVVDVKLTTVDEYRMYTITILPEIGELLGES